MLESIYQLLKGNLIMERTVPVRASEEIELYLRTIYSLIRSSNEVHIRSLEEVHGGMNSSLHTHAREAKPDISAMSYTLLRLPACIMNVKRVILGQTASTFIQHGIGDVETWQQVSARARRRKCYYDGKDQLVCFIASRSDIDDVIPALTALQIEWNKINLLLIGFDVDIIDKAKPGTEPFNLLAKRLGLAENELARLAGTLGEDFRKVMKIIASRRSDMLIRVLNGSLNDYRHATENWWQNLERQLPQLKDRPIYFVSSNTHSLPNLLTSFGMTKKTELIEFIHHEDQAALLGEWQEIQNESSQSDQANFFNYVLKKYQSTPEGAYLLSEQQQFEVEHGIYRFPSIHSFDVECDIIDIAKLNPAYIDARLFHEPESGAFCLDCLKKSHALIVNIDYPLGASAYHLLTKIAENVPDILGIYVMGKAASLNGVVGDVIIPSIVYDEHSKNTYLFNNNFSAEDVSPFLTYGTVMDNQKAVSVLGTFLQNSNIMDVIYREGYTDIEMEAGPYLSAIYELYRPQRHPVNEIVDLHKLPFDLGILHYVSDTPMSKGKNLGAGTMSYFGMDSTYAVSLAILKRILHIETGRLTSKPN